MKKAVQCTIKTVTLPRILPASVFVAWKMNGEASSSPMYKADQPLLDIDFSFPLFWAQKEENVLEISLNASNSAKNKYRFGGSSFILPMNEIEDKKEQSRTITIDSSAGQFSITLSLEKGRFPIPREEASHFENTIITPVEQYNELVTQMKSFPDKIHPTSVLWGDGGLLDLLASFSKLDLSVENIDLVKSTENVLPIKLKNSKHFTAILTDCISLLLSRDLLFVTEDGKKGTISDLENQKRYPYLAVIICKYIEEQKDDDMYNTEDNLTCIVNLICNLICHPETQSSATLYLLSTIFFLGQFLQKNCQGKYLVFLSYLQTGNQTGMIRYLDFIAQGISPIVHDQKFILAFIESTREDLMLNGLTNAYIDKLMDVVYHLIDFNVVRKWIFESSTDNIQMNNLTTTYSSFKWPYIHALETIISQASTIISKKKFPAGFPADMQGDYFQFSVIRLVNCGKFKFTEKDIASVTKTKIIMNPPDIYMWSFENNKIEIDPTYSCSVTKL